MGASSPPGWYPDPGHTPRQRYWDGQQWTQQFRPLPNSKRYAWAWGIGAAVFLFFILGGWSLLSSLGESPDRRDASSTSRSPIFVPQDESTTTPTPQLSTSDFRVGVIVTGVECFGSAGCLVDYMIDPVYVGTADLPPRTTVVYEVRGGDEPQTDSFTVDSSGAPQRLTEKHIEAQANGSLQAVVIRVLPGR